jgi:hypothetical protein
MHLEMQGIRRSLGPLRVTPQDKQSLRHSRAGRSAGARRFFNEIIVGARFRKNYAKYRFVLPIIFDGPFEVGNGRASPA